LRGADIGEGAFGEWLTGFGGGQRPLPGTGHFRWLHRTLPNAADLTARLAGITASPPRRKYELPDPE